MVVEYNRSCTWRRPLRAPRDAPLGGRCAEIEGRESPPPTHRDTSQDIQTDFVRKSSSGSRSGLRGWEDMILPSHEDPCDCVYPQRLRHSVGDQTLRNLECVSLLDDEMMSIYPGVSQIYTPHSSAHLHNARSPYTDLCSLQMYLEDVIEQVWRCIWRLRWS
jgi:hypothetical protein